MTYVMADLHGRDDWFVKALKEILVNDEDAIYLLGDVIDRHPYGIRIIKEAMKSKNIKMLLGNHEQMMLDALDSTGEEFAIDKDRALERWYRNGGKVTHDYLKRIAKTERQDIFDYLHGLPYEVSLTVSGKKFKLVHAAPSDIYPLYRGAYKSEKQLCLWHRMREYDLAQETNETIIFGHTPTVFYKDNNPPEVYYSEDGKKIAIDCGCAFPKGGIIRNGQRVFGRLSCLRLDDMAVFFSIKDSLGSDVF